MAQLKTKPSILSTETFTSTRPVKPSQRSTRFVTEREIVVLLVGPERLTF